MRHLLHRLLIFIAALGCCVSAYSQIDIENVLNMGRRSVGVDDYVSAIRYFNQVAEARPTDYRAFYYRAYAKFSLGDYQGAHRDCTQAIACNPYIPEVYQLRGLCRIHLDDFRGAIADYDAVVAQMPDEQTAYYNRALCKLEVKEYAAANADMDIVLRKWPELDRAYLVKAQIRFAENDTVGGIQWIDSLLARNPKISQAWEMKGQHALIENRFDDADSCLTKAIELAPHEVSNYIARAQARHALHRFGQSLADYDEAIRLDPNHYVAHYNRGLLRALVGDDNRAIDDFDFVLSVAPDNTLATYNRALLREQTGDYQGAIDDYNRLLATHPNFVEGHEARGRCRRRIGDKRGAIEDETIVARSRLDMTFRPGKRKPIYKVRKPGEQDLAQYQHLVEEEADTTRRYVGQLFGKLQYKHVACEPLPHFALQMDEKLADATFAHTPYLPELEALNRVAPSLPPIRLAQATPRTDGTATEGDYDVAMANHTHGLFVRSIVDAQAGRLDAALRQVEQALEAEGGNYLMLLHHANLLLQQGLNHGEGQEVEGIAPDREKLLQALSSLDRAIECSPGNAVLLYNRGCIFYHLGLMDEALSCFAQATTIDHRMPQAHYNSAIVLLAQNKHKEAIEALSVAGEQGVHQAYSLIRRALRESNKESKDK